MYFVYKRNRFIKNINLQGITIIKEALKMEGFMRKMLHRQLFLLTLMSSFCMLGKYNFENKGPEVKKGYSSAEHRNRLRNEYKDLNHFFVGDAQKKVIEDVEFLLEKLTNNPIKSNKSLHIIHKHINSSITEITNDTHKNR